MNNPNDALSDGAVKAVEITQSAAAEISARLNKHGITKDDRQILQMFWHPIDKEVIKTLPKEVLVYRKMTATRNHTYAEPEQMLDLLLQRMLQKGLLRKTDEFGVNVPRVLELTDVGIHEVTKQNPQYSQFTLMLIDLLNNKLALASTILGIITAIMFVLQFFGLLPFSIHAK